MKQIVIILFVLSSVLVNAERIPRQLRFPSSKSSRGSQQTRPLFQPVFRPADDSIEEDEEQFPRSAQRPVVFRGRPQVADDEDDQQIFFQPRAPPQRAPQRAPQAVASHVPIQTSSSQRPQQSGKFPAASQSFQKGNPNEVEEEEKEEESKPDRLTELLGGSKFDCAGKKLGYYADEGLSCEVFHYCSDGVRHSWLCPQGQNFHQIHLICMPAGDENICAQSQKYHFVNDYLYKPINEGTSESNDTLRYHDRFFPDGSEQQQQQQQQQQHHQPRQQQHHQPRQQQQQIPQRQPAHFQPRPQFNQDDFIVQQQQPVRASPQFSSGTSSGGRLPQFVSSARAPARSFRPQSHRHSSQKSNFNRARHQDDEDYDD